MRRTDRCFIRATLLALIGLAAIPHLAPAQGESESWDAIFIGNNKVGYVHTQVIPKTAENRPLLNVLVDTNISVRRGADANVMTLRYGTIETLDGEVYRLDTRTKASNSEIRAYGDVDPATHQMTLKIENGRQTQQQVIPWGPDVRGPYGAEMSFARKPMQPGEVRTVRTFVPDYNRVVDVTLTARAVETVNLGGGAVRDLLKVEQQAADAGKPMPELAQTFWADSLGQIMKSYSDNFGGMTTYRTTKEAATRRVAKAEQFDLLNGMIIPVARKITNPEASRDILYKVSLTDADPATLFPTDRRQALKPGAEAHSATMTIRTAGPEAGTPGPETVEAEFTRSNPLVTSADVQVVRLARRAAGDAVDPWAKAQAITKWVASNIKEKNFETSFAPADEVARNLQGDCTEHAVLTAAMCRAEGIPARVVVGLVYASHLNGFGYHMWDEVYVNRRWVAVDSAFDQSTVDAVHIKLSETSLDGVSPFESFTAVARVATKLKLEPIEVR